MTQSKSEDPSPSQTVAPPQEGTYQVKLPSFEGPLDLLLHLIRINEIEITDIPIIEITRQYSAMLELMRELNLEVAGEYLVMASTLVHIKSKMLLPSDPRVTEEEAEDPRSELARQLLDYERYRQAALCLRESEMENLKCWRRPTALVSDYLDEAALEVDLFALLTAFKKMLDSMEKEEQAALARDRESQLDRIRWLLGRLEETPRIEFTCLFEGGITREDLILTFLALLELIRLRAVKTVQTDSFGEIEIHRIQPPANLEIELGKMIHV